ATSLPEPQRGDVWMLNFDPTVGHEQGGTRPAVVVSDDTFNLGPAGLVIVLPVTSRSKRIRTHVEVVPPEGGLTLTSYIKCEDIRSVSKQRLVDRLGSVSPLTLAEAEDRLRILIGL
ncbi:MAG TPA: type II toxin-antitoxin system PemK/MazF family toxin, partial [Chthonomonadaceae bacterium]|nr:type II toxin-antitoxin system PemK/MazF family toxin [Chthonomonadaceae bacterium]